MAKLDEVLGISFEHIERFRLKCLSLCLCELLFEHEDGDIAGAGAIAALFALGSIDTPHVVHATFHVWFFFNFVVLG